MTVVAVLYCLVISFTKQTFIWRGKNCLRISSCFLSISTRVVHFFDYPATSICELLHSSSGFALTRSPMNFWWKIMENILFLGIFRLWMGEKGRQKLGKVVRWDGQQNIAIALNHASTKFVFHSQWPNENNKLSIGKFCRSDGRAVSRRKGNR